MYCDTVVSRGRLTIDEFAPQVSFFFYTHSDFFEEVAKYRAGRRLWANTVRERFGATTESACMFRVGCVAGGASLYAPQAQNNVVRVAYEAMASVLGGVQSMFTAAWDEPFALPSAESATLALRTQQVLALETGVTRVVDPLGGSFYVEELTDRMESTVVGIMADIDGAGGMVHAVESGYVQRLIADAAYQHYQAVHAGSRKVVGVNTLTSEEEPPEIATFEMDPEARALQLRRLAHVKMTRDDDDVTRHLRALKLGASHDDVNLMPLLIDCAPRLLHVG